MPAMSAHLSAINDTGQHRFLRSTCKQWHGGRSSLDPRQVDQVHTTHMQPAKERAIGLQ
jgi:hypothetical protein